MGRAFLHVLGDIEASFAELRAGGVVYNSLSCLVLRSLPGLLVSWKGRVLDYSRCDLNDAPGRRPAPRSRGVHHAGTEARRTSSFTQ